MDDEEIDVERVPTVLVLATTLLEACATDDGIDLVDVSEGTGDDNEPDIFSSLQG